jgi:hypothetical protein
MLTRDQTTEFLRTGDVVGLLEHRNVSDALHEVDPPSLEGLTREQMRQLAVHETQGGRRIVTSHGPSLYTAICMDTFLNINAYEFAKFSIEFKRSGHEEYVWFGFSDPRRDLPPQESSVCMQQVFESLDVCGFQGASDEAKDIFQSWPWWKIVTSIQTPRDVQIILKFFGQPDFSRYLPKIASRIRTVHPHLCRDIGLHE